MFRLPRILQTLYCSFKKITESIFFRSTHSASIKWMEKVRASPKDWRDILRRSSGGWLARERGPRKPKSHAQLKKNNSHNLFNIQRRFQRRETRKGSSCQCYFRDPRYRPRRLGRHPYVDPPVSTIAVLETTLDRPRNQSSVISSATLWLGPCPMGRPCSRSVFPRVHQLRHCTLPEPSPSIDSIVPANSAAPHTTTGCNVAVCSFH
jgi:hypothetical protein